MSLGVGLNFGDGVGRTPAFPSQIEFLPHRGFHQVRTRWFS